MYEIHTSKTEAFIVFNMTCSGKYYKVDENDKIANEIPAPEGKIWFSSGSIYDCHRWMKSMGWE